MSSLSISIPESIRERVESLAREDGVSIDSFIATILSQRVAVADADSYVRRRAGRGNTQQMLEILSQAPKVDPEPFDRLEPASGG
jgi:hypothetical protein